ncbi:MAG TPA: hypothetical protein VJY34_22065 [Roseiarcus sp.]|nr:hypothetical protein [Roseiarcus sp.]
MKHISKAILVAIGMLAAAPALAVDLPTKKPAPAPIPEPVLPTWRFELTGYGWGAGLLGNAGVGQFQSVPFYANVWKILEHLDGVFMGSAIARNGTFIGGLDLIWTRLGETETLKNGTEVDVKLGEDIVTGFGGVRIPVGPPNLELYGTLGARYFALHASIALTHPLVPFGASASATKDWIDPVAGIAAQYRFDPKWFINAQADLGGLDNSATGQALGSVGYNWTQNISSTLGYRVIYGYDKENNAFNGAFRLQQWMYGPFAALKYSF